MNSVPAQAVVQQFFDNVLNRQDVSASSQILSPDHVAHFAGMPAPLKALCVVPFGMEEGTDAAIAGREFGLAVGEPAEFRFLTSTIRKNDPPGALIEDWGDDLEELAPLEVTLDKENGGGDGQVVPVTLESRVTELGTLELWCAERSGDHRWKLELNIRDS